MNPLRPHRVLLAVVAAVLVAGCAGPGPDLAGSVRAGAESTPAAPSAPATTTTEMPTGPGQEQVSVAGEPRRIEVPSLGLAVEIGAVTQMVDGVIDPPTLEKAHRIRGIADPDVLPGPTAPNSVFLAGHAWDQGEAAFTALNDAQVGAEVVLGTDSGRLTYRIVSVDVVPKQDISAFTPAWQIRPGGLVLLTCSARDDGWPDNRVIIAEFVG